MAGIEIFFGNIENINLTASVGKNGVNLKDDVLVVQAMLKYALEIRPYFRKFKFPGPTGTMDEETKALIKEFQKYLRRNRDQDVAVDGVISRAVGESPSGRRSFWAILLLNTYAMDAVYYHHSDGNHIANLCRKFPQLSRILGDSPVGSLGLTLEPSFPRGIGSLNLSLE